MAGTASVITYTRGNTYVRNLIAGAGSNATYAHGLVGTLEVGGQIFDTIERMDGYVHMAGDKTYANSTMSWDSRYTYVINPWLGKDAEATKRKNILFHRGSRPSHFEGCVGVGKLIGAELTESAETMAKIWELVGGKRGETSRQIVVTVTVVGQMKDRSLCTEHGASQYAPQSGGSQYGPRPG